MIWQTRNRTFDFTRRGAVMGILNVTPDSFSDGGRWSDVDAAVAQAERMIAERAEIIDIGGESTRPGAAPVSESEEMRRVIPVIERLAALGGGFAVSVDTMKPAVAREACRAGASIINDVGGLRDDAMIAAAAETGAGVVIMHMQGTPGTMQTAPNYENVSREVRDFFCNAISRAVNGGVPETRIVLDPGIGFGKTVEHNLELLRRLPGNIVPSSQAPRPVLLGVSRKSFIGKILGSPRIEDREWPTVALTSYGREKGVRIFRVHDVKPNVEALRMTEAILAC
ncbi:MAG: Dihydropteroate synthase [Verrucomicrobiota bacterium]|jgi:dihydropteroate synthase